MYTETDICKDTSEQVYQRGRRLFQSGNVQNIQLQDVYIETNPCKKVKAYVQGSGWKCYNTQVVVDENNNELHSYHCECPAYMEYAGLCKHCVATLLRYIQVRQDMLRKQQQPVKKLSVEFPQRLEQLERTPGISKGSALYGTQNQNSLKKRQSSMPVTDRGMYRILMDHGLEQQLPYRQPLVRGKVQLVPQCHDYHGKITVEFRIGITHLYVLKDIKEFVSLMDKHEYKSYGAKLGFYHHISAFEESSQPLVHFLMDIMKSFQTMGGLNVYQYYSRNDVKREIPLAAGNLDRFMQIMLQQENPLELDTQNTNAAYYEIKEEEPKPVLHITGVPAGIRISTMPLAMTEGASCQYIYDHANGIIYRNRLEEIAQIRSFRKYMNDQGGQNIFIAERELPLFCRDLLPFLEQHYEMDVREFTPGNYLPPKAEFAIYLDMPEYDTITCRLCAVYGEESYDVFSVENDVAKFVDMPTGAEAQRRDISRELEMDAAVSQYFPEFDGKIQRKVLHGDADAIYEFLNDGLVELGQLGEVYISEQMKRVQVLNTPAFSMGLSLKSGLLELTLDSPELSMEELAEVLTRYNRRKKYYRLKNGSFLNMQDTQMNNLVEMVDGLQLSARQLKSGKILIPQYRALYLDSLSHEEGAEYIHRDRSFKQLVRNMRSMEDSDYEVPQELEHVMREYQKSGFRWLKALQENGFGGILADDMGLGKTLQVIAFLMTERKRTLIVCPASLVYNWQSEIERFAPELRPVMVTGDAAHRRELVQSSLDTDILITSYDLLKRDVDNYENMEFFCEILDEAQFIKNQSTQAAKAVKLIHAGTRFALTGTPMENRLSELWSIFDYLMPGFLYGYKQFKEEMEAPIVEEHDQDAMLRLRRMITPFILRRLKKDVLSDLPDKLEEAVYARMESRQQELYEANVQNLKRLLNGQTDAQFREKKLQLLAELTKLRQICCNPLLVYENYKGESAKQEMCVELLKNAITGGHKVLLFSQFTSMLELLAKRAEKENITYYMLTGQTPKEQRIQMVDAFNSNDVSVFFISLKAGGTGLNLTSADIVIHYDPWWNLAAQNQATDRTHRIGQKNVVTVYKLIAKDTIEEKIMKLQEMKQELADQVLGGENMDNPSFSRDELLELLS